MKIAVPYIDGAINEHFGKSAQFRIYTVENGNIVDATTYDSEGQGHDAVSAFLASKEVNVVICSNIGEGSMHALASAGIQIIPGITGDADMIVGGILDGSYQPEPSEGGCGGGCGNCGGGCGDGEGGCGGCGGGCGGCGGSRAPLFEGPNVGKACIVNYEGSFNDGKIFDSSFERGEPIQFICGVGMMIPGFDKAVATMKIGETVNIHLMPEEAYGEVNPNQFLEIPFSTLPGSEELNIGDQVFLANAYGQEFPVRVVDKTEDTIKFDANHEMAGKELNFRIELVDVIES